MRVETVPDHMEDRQGTSAVPAAKSRLEWGAVLLALALAVVHVYLGLTTDAGAVPTPTQSFVIAGILLVGVVLYFSAYWHPVFYLLAAVFVVYLGNIWVFTGLQHFALGALTGVIATAFVVVVLYLLVREYAPS